MTISDLIRRLESLRDQYGSLPVYIEYDGSEYEPVLSVSSTREVINRDTYEAEEVPDRTRVIIKKSFF